MFSDEHKFKQFKGGNPRHNFVWAKSVGEVPGKEMERWGLTVDAWGGFSWQGKTDLVFYEDTLDAPAYQDILENSLLPAAKEWFGDEKEGWELQQDKATCHTTKSTKAWLERHEVAVVEEWPTKGDDNREPLGHPRRETCAQEVHDRGRNEKSNPQIVG